MDDGELANVWDTCGNSRESEMRVSGTKREKVAPVTVAVWIGQLLVLVGEEIDTIKNAAQLEFARP